MKINFIVGKILKKIKYNLVFMFVVPFLITDKPLDDRMTEIFKLYFSLYTDYCDWRFRTATCFCMYKGLPHMILAIFTGKTPIIKDEIDINNLKTVIGMEDFRNWYFKNYKEKWLKEKWYGKNLPIICKLKKNYIIIDGNHRFAQQIYHNEIKYNFIEIDGWMKLFFKYVLKGKNK